MSALACSACYGLFAGIYIYIVMLFVLGENGDAVDNFASVSTIDILMKLSRFSGADKAD